MTAARLWMIAVTLAAGSAPLRGHHAFAAYYLQDQSVRSRTHCGPATICSMTGSPSRNPSESKQHLKRIARPSDRWTWMGRGERF